MGLLPFREIFDYLNEAKHSDRGTYFHYDHEDAQFVHESVRTDIVTPIKCTFSTSSRYRQSMTKFSKIFFTIYNFILQPMEELAQDHGEVSVEQFPETSGSRLVR